MNSWFFVANLQTFSRRCLRIGEADPDGPRATKVTTPMEPVTYRIRASHLRDATRRISAANRRLERAGIVDGFVFTTADHIVINHDTGIGEAFVDLTLERPVISLAGWVFAGAFETTAAGAMLAVYRLDQDVPTPADFACEQCGVTRQRERVYILRHTDEGTGQLTHKQVGKSCIALTLGVAPVGLWALTYDLDIEEFDDSSDPGPTLSHGDAWYPLVPLLEKASAVSMQGSAFVARANAGKENPATVDVVIDSWAVTIPAPDDQALVSACLDWLDALVGDNSEYIDNLRLAAESGTNIPLNERFVRHKHAPLVVSAIGAYARSLEKLESTLAAAALRSTFQQAHLAGVGEKIVDVPVTVLRTRITEGTYGTTTMVEMLTDDAFLLVWWASGFKDLADGSSFTLRATVKGNEMYRDMFQTIVTRAKLEPRD